MQKLPIDVSKYELIILDADGTIADRDSTALFEDVAPVLRGIALADPSIRFAIASNQGGVGCRLWMEDGGWGNPNEMPTQAKVEERFEWLQSAVSEAVMGPVEVYLAFAFQSSRSKKWSPKPLEMGPSDKMRPTTDMRWDQSWRKPSPGMIYAAIADVTGHHKTMLRSRVLVVGDSDEDREAARMANAHFMSAAEFFGRGSVVVHAFDLPYQGHTLKFGELEFKTPDLSGCIHYANDYTTIIPGIEELGVTIIDGNWRGPQAGDKFWVNNITADGQNTWCLGECL